MRAAVIVLRVEINPAAEFLYDIVLAFPAEMRHIREVNFELHVERYFERLFRVFRAGRLTVGFYRRFTENGRFAVCSPVFVQVLDGAEQGVLVVVIERRTVRFVVDVSVFFTLYFLYCQWKPSNKNPLRG